MYVFPRARFVDGYTIQQQIDHLDSEVVEVRQAYASPYIVRLAEELYDVVHSAETCLRMLERDGCDVSVVLPVRQVPSSLVLYSQIKRLGSRMCLVRYAATPQCLMYALSGVIATADSALITLSRLYAVDIAQVRRDVEQKNGERGYYSI